MSEPALAQVGRSEFYAFGQKAIISAGSVALEVRHTLAAVETFQAPVLDCRRNTLGPGFTRAAAHIHGEAIAHWYFSMIEPDGSAARMETSVHSPAAGVVDAEPNVEGCLRAPELDGMLRVGVADGVALFDETDEQPATASPQATSSAAPLTPV